MSTEIERAAEWLLSDDTGMSSKALCARMMGGKPKMDGFNYPSDPSDFGRCYRLLKLIPEWRARLHEMSDCGPYWKALVEQWDAIEASYLAETAVGPHAEKTYKLMKSILDPIEDADGSVIRFGNGSSMRFT